MEAIDHCELEELLLLWAILNRRIGDARTVERWWKHPPRAIGGGLTPTT